MPDLFKPRWEALNRSPLGQTSLALLKHDPEMGCSPDRETALGKLLSLALDEGLDLPTAEELVSRLAFQETEKQLRVAESLHRRLDPISGSPTLQGFLKAKDPEGAAKWLLQELDLTLR